MKKKSKLKITENEFKDYLLHHYVDENGAKISDRLLWSTEEFFDYTGMYAINKFTQKRTIVSTGTISYWKKKLNLNEENVYLFHKNITKKIDKNTTFEEWSRKFNKGYKKNIKTTNRETTKSKLIKYAGLPPKYSVKTLDEITMIAMKIWETVGVDPHSEMQRFYEEVV